MTDKNLLEWAWGIIANAGGGNWIREVPEWRDAAAKWRDAYHLALDKKTNSCHVENMKFKCEIGDVVWFVQENCLQQGIVCSRSLVERDRKFFPPKAKEHWPLGVEGERYAITPLVNNEISHNEGRMFVLEAKNVYRNKQEYIAYVNSL